MRGRELAAEQPREHERSEVERELARREREARERRAGADARERDERPPAPPIGRGAERQRRRERERGARRLDDHLRLGACRGVAEVSELHRRQHRQSPARRELQREVHDEPDERRRRGGVVIVFVVVVVVAAPLVGSGAEGVVVMLSLRARGGGGGSAHRAVDQDRRKPHKRGSLPDHAGQAALKAGARMVEWRLMSHMTTWCCGSTCLLKL